MIVPLDGIARARLVPANGRHAFSGGFVTFAARDAYPPGFNAAWAYVIHRTGRRPKTHAGTRSEFVRLIREHGDLSPGYGVFLARGYDNKVEADDGDGVPATPEEADRALAQAERFVGEVERILLAEDQSA